MNSSIKTLLERRAEQVLSTTELLLEQTRDWQVIKQYLCNRLIDEETLTEKQKGKLTRYQFIYNQLVTGKYTDTEVLNQVVKTYKVKINQAYNDLACARELYGTVLNINKRFEINLQLQINRNMQRKADELGDMKAVAALEKNRALLLKLLPDEEENPAEHFEGHELEAVFDPKLIGAPSVDIEELLTLINEKRKVKIDMTKIITDIPYEEINDKTTPLQ